MPLPAPRTDRWWASAAIGLASSILALLLAEAFLRWVVPYRFVYRHPEFVVEAVAPADAGAQMAEPLFGAGLRYVDGPWVYGLKRDMRARLVSSEFDVSVRTDERGFRIGGEARPSSGYRTLGLGDSFGMGYGVEYDQTYLSRLARAPGDGSIAATTNAAVVGYDPGNSYEFLLSQGLDLHPDLVVFQLWSGDDLCGSPEPTRPLPAGSLSREWQLRYLVRRSHLAMLLRDRARGAPAVRRWLFGRGLAVPFSSEGMLLPGFADRCGPSLTSLAAMLTTADRRCREAGAHLVVLLIPMREQVYPDDLQRALDYNLSTRRPGDLDLEGPSRALHEALEGDGVDLLDLLPDFRAATGPLRLYYSADPHLTAAGHGLVAAALRQHLARRP